MMGNEFLFQPDGKPIVTAWESFTPTGTWSTNVTYAGRKRRIGDTGFYFVKVTCSGAPDATSLAFNMPSGEVIDTTKLPATSGNQPLGDAYIEDSGSTLFPGTANYGTTTTVGIFAFSANSTYAQCVGVSSTVPFTFASGDFVIACWCAPIVGW